MVFYHGSNRPIENNLLLKDYREDKTIYLTDEYTMAVFYAGCGFRSWKWNEKTQKLIIIERCKDMLKKLYENKKAIIYKTENLTEFEKMEQRNGKNCFVIKDRDVKLFEIEKIDNIYQKLIDLYNKGQIEIWFWKDASYKKKVDYKKQLMKVFNQEVMKKEKELSEECYKDIVKCFPYLRIKHEK